MCHLETMRLIEAAARAGSNLEAADNRGITASALLRRIDRFETECGFQVLDRLPTGVRLNPARELLLQHSRATRSDLARVPSQVADLSGERRGQVSIACSQVLLPWFLPDQIARSAASTRASPSLSMCAKGRRRNRSRPSVPATSR